MKSRRCCTVPDLGAALQVELNVMLEKSSVTLSERATKSCPRFPHSSSIPASSFAGETVRRFFSPWCNAGADKSGECTSTLVCTIVVADVGRAQKAYFNANSICRLSVAVLVMLAPPTESTSFPGSPKFGWLKKLKNSARNST